MDSDPIEIKEATKVNLKIMVPKLGLYNPFEEFLSCQSIDFDKWLQGSNIEELVAIESSIANNPQGGNISGYLRPYIKLYPQFKKLEAS